MLISTQFPQPMKHSRTRAETQPRPQTRGLTRKRVRDHASRMFRDVFSARPLTYHEWRLAEADLMRRLENTGW